MLGRECPQAVLPDRALYLPCVFFTAVPIIKRFALGPVRNPVL
jgi:hypothetical protein